MKIQVDNLKAQLLGFSLTIQQQADALVELNKLIDYVEELEQANEIESSTERERLIAFREFVNEDEEAYLYLPEKIIDRFLGN